MNKYNQFYRLYGVRKEEGLRSFKYPSTMSFSLPRLSIYHALPVNSTDQTVDPNDLLINSAEGETYCVHVDELRVQEGMPTRLPVSTMSLIRQLEKQNRKLRRVRKFDVVDRQPRSLIIYNYALLQNLYRYRVNFLNTWQRWYNGYGTMWENVNELAAQSERNQFIRFDIPLSFPQIASFIRASNGLTRDLLETFNSPALMQLLDLWKWAGGLPSAMDAVAHKHLDKINLVFVDSDRVGVINLFMLKQWRDQSLRIKDKDEEEDDEFVDRIEKNLLGAKGAMPRKRASGAELFQRKVLAFAVRLAQLRSMNADAQLGNQRPVEDEDGVVTKAEGTTQGSGFDDFDNDDYEAKGGFDSPDDYEPVSPSQLPDVAPGQRDKVQEIDLSLFEQEVSDDDLLDDSFFVVNAPEMGLAAVPAEAEEVAIQDAQIIADPKMGVLVKADDLAERGILSVAENRRFHKLAEKYKELDNPWGEGTVEELATVKPEHLVLSPENIKIKLPKGVDAIFDESMLESTLLEFDKKYLSEVLHKHIAQSILSVQRAGVAVSDFQVDRVVDALNKYDIITVRLVPVAGSPSTVRMTIPVIENDGSWMADGSRYHLRKQRGDMPIHKVNPSRVALTSYSGKLFVERSKKVVNDFDNWLQTEIIGSFMAENGLVKKIEYRSGGKKFGQEVRPRLYTGLGQRFSRIVTETWELRFEPEKAVEHYGEGPVEFAKNNGLTLFGKSGNSFLAVDERDNIFTINGRSIEVYGGIAELFGVDPFKAPVEITEMKVAGKSIPVGVVLAYYLGFDALLERTGAQVRRVQKGTRINLEKDEFAIRFFDETLVFSRQDRMAALLFGGFLPFSRQTANYTYRDFNSPDVYLNVIEGRGLGIRQLRALDDHRLFFIDPITLQLLEEMKEPTDFIGLLMRSTELLTNDAVPIVDDRFRGYERIAGAVYRELTAAVKQYRRRPVSSKASVELNPNAVWMAIQTDPSKGMIEDANPINYLKEQESVTFGGTGGRSSRSMVRSTRAYNPRDYGIVSEATKDSSDVAISTYFSANPKLTNLLGVTAPGNVEETPLTSVLSTSALCAPGALHDDPKRVNFISIQNSSSVASIGNVHSPLRTGYEQVMAHRLGPLYAFSTKRPGRVTKVTKDALVVTYDDGEIVGVELGKRFGVVSGTVVPHEIKTDAKVGDTFEQGTVLAWNSGFFIRDRWNPTQVVAITGVLMKVAIVDGADTHEDSCALSARANALLASEMTEVRTLILKFDQKVSNLVAEGDALDADDNLCIIEDPLTANSGLFDDLSQDTLRMLSAQTPRAKVTGRVDKIEVFYRGDVEDMSESLQDIVKYYDKKRAAKVRELRQETSTTGEVLDRVRIGGNSLEYDSVAIRVYLTHTIPMGVGDKGVFANQMKTISGRTFQGRHETESGLPYDAFFSNSSMFNRIVESPYIWGTTNSLLLTGSKNAAAIYRGTMSYGNH